LLYLTLFCGEQNSVVDGLVSHQTSSDRPTVPKTITYWITGTRRPNFRAEGTPVDLLPWILGFPPSADVPPLAVVNAVCGEGSRSCGFNGDAHWEPFALTPAEYEEFVQMLLADPEKGYRILESPAWIKTEIDWSAYVASVRYGIPLEPYRKLLYKYDELVEQTRAARRSGSKWRWRVATFRLMRVIRRQQRLIMRYGGRARDPP
jgi:hypothetical protein